jgi:hypothetical protein
VVQPGRVQEMQNYWAVSNWLPKLLLLCPFEFTKSDLVIASG